MPKRTLNALKSMLKKHSSTIVALILFLFFAISIIVSSQESTTMDEKAHIPSAYSYVKYNDMRLNPEHPPLLKDLAGLPLLFFNPKFPDTDPFWTQGINEQWELGNKFIHSNDAEKITFWSRFPIILISLLLGFFIFRWTKEIAGAMAGIFALILYAFDPNIIGHSHYVTTDIGIAAFIFISFYYFIKFIKKPSLKNTVLAGIFLGLVQLAKFSAVLLFPLFGLITVVYALAKKKPDFDERTNLKFKWEKFWEYVGKYALAVIICFAAIWVLYFYNTFNMPAGKIQDIANLVFGNEGIGKIAKLVVIQMSNIPILKPLSEYFLGVFMVFARVAGGNTYYFFGKVANQATPLYFPVVFLLKETIPFLILILFTSIYTVCQTVKNIATREGNLFRKIWAVTANYLRTGVVQYSMFGFILLYSYLSITGNLNIGFRHLFPILPFAYFLVSKKVFDFMKNIRHEFTRKIFTVILIIFSIWIILEPIIYYPSYLSYFNELTGGPKNGYQYVTDSNYDWGQDLKRLKNWVAEHNTCFPPGSNPAPLSPEMSKICHEKFAITVPIDKIYVDYFGGSNPRYYLGDKFVPGNSEVYPQSGWYAISAVFLQESIHKEKKPGEKSYQWTQAYEPIRIGDSIFVYYVK